MIDVIYSTYFFVKTLILLNLITKVSHIKIIQVTFINFSFIYHNFTLY